MRDIVSECEGGEKLREECDGLLHAQELRIASEEQQDLGETDEQRFIVDKGFAKLISGRLALKAWQDDAEKVEGGVQETHKATCRQCR